MKAWFFMPYDRKNHTLSFNSNPTYFPEKNGVLKGAKHEEGMVLLS